MVFFLLDEILIVDYYGKCVYVLEYDFVVDGKFIKGLLCIGESCFYILVNIDLGCGDYELGEYVRLVEKVKDYFCCGDFFEIVFG